MAKRNKSVKAQLSTFVENGQRLKILVLFEDGWILGSDMPIPPDQEQEDFVARFDTRLEALKQHAQEENRELDPSIVLSADTSFIPDNCQAWLEVFKQEYKTRSKPTAQTT